MSEPEFTESTTVPTKNKTKKLRLRYTNYFLTINTNKKFNQNSEQYDYYEFSLKNIVNTILNTKTLKHYVLFLENGK